MSIQSALRTIRLMVGASSEKSFYFKNEHGEMQKAAVRDAAIRTLARPPIVLSAPTTKRVWAQDEIEAFYKTNPHF